MRPLKKDRTIGFLVGVPTVSECGVGDRCWWTLSARSRSTRVLLRPRGRRSGVWPEASSRWTQVRWAAEVSVAGDWGEMAKSWKRLFRYSNYSRVQLYNIYSICYIIYIMLNIRDEWKYIFNIPWVRVREEVVVEDFNVSVWAKWFAGNLMGSPRRAAAVIEV